MERNQLSDKFPIGSVLPEFTLPATDGKTWSSSALAGAPAMVIFTCNHCPYVKGSEQALIKIFRQFESKGLKAVAISSNDANQYPEDGFDKMKEKSAEMALPYPYLYDESQDIARLFDAACTPEIYLFSKDGLLAYHGAINDSPRDSSKVTKEYLVEALNALMDGRKPNLAFANPMGCSIKWKE